MSSRVDDFFEAIGRVSDNGQTRTVALATTDSIYAGATTSKVTFDGETTLSAKSYRMIGTITASSRVLLLRVGPSWVIIGALK